MKLTFIGLSCFLFENEAGYRLVIDPFEDDDRFTLGPKFPKELFGKPFGANLVLFSESDPDHSRPTYGWQQEAPQVKPGEIPFPDLKLKGIVLQEYNGEPCIGWSFTVDGVRFLHLSDMSYALPENQIEEIGTVDVVFISPPKTNPNMIQSREFVDQIIKSLEPKLTIWSHHLAPEGLDLSNPDEIRNFFVKYLKENARKNSNYKDESSFIELSYILENALLLNNQRQGEIINDHTIELNRGLISSLKSKAMLFAKMLAE